jgi:uncharacterized protein YukE
LSDVEVVPGDPASCSTLGGALRRQAESLRERRTALWHSATGLHGWTGPAADAFVERLRLQLGEVDQMVSRLDDLGAALQAYATDLAHARAQGDLAMDYVSRHGLTLDAEGAVRPRSGPVAVEVAIGRREAMPQAQHHVDGSRAEARAAASRLRRRTSISLQALRSDAGRLAGMDGHAR